MRQLAGALINNFYLMFTKLTMLYLIAIPALILLYVSTGSEMAAGFLPFVIIVGFPSATMENASVPFSTKWTAFENAWGLAPVFMVISRYLLFIILTAIGVAFWTVLPFEFQSFMAGFEFTIAHYVIAGQLMCVVFYPILYLLNPKQDSVGIIVLFASMGAGIALTIAVFAAAGSNLLLLWGIVALLLVVSVVLSAMFNAMHRGRVA